MSRPEVRVVKLGGSLLQRPELPRLAEAWLAENNDAINVILVGGGVWADGVRDAYARFDLEESFCHWLCIDLLEQTGQLAARLLKLPLIADWQSLDERLAQPTACGTNLIYTCGQFLREVDPSLAGASLPQSWQVTTDSIAARLATRLKACELVLWKSSLPEAAVTDIAQWSRLDYVDGYFPHVAGGLPVRAVDLLSGRELSSSGEATNEGSSSNRRR